MTDCEGDPDAVGVALEEPDTDDVLLIDEDDDRDGVPPILRVEDDDDVIELDGLTERDADALGELDMLCGRLADVD